MTLRSLFELHACGGTSAEFAEQFTARWHDSDWDAAEDHWQLIVNRLLQGRDLEGLKPGDALRIAEQQAQTFAVSLLRSPDPTRCPMCAIAPPRSAPESRRPAMEPR
ncbi:DUF6313 family protein [Streptomyces sp. NBC_01092]|uniref:DUF6313 family protein n=1 Tax=Streptomyces sp. NBC_01092 TaxID=2903748 RepID=UPI00386389AF|nr:DUF6313 family protein [Streptomyces sp. NBC_01092]